MPIENKVRNSYQIVGFVDDLPEDVRGIAPNPELQAAKDICRATPGRWLEVATNAKHWHSSAVGAGFEARSRSGRRFLRYVGTQS